MKFKFAPLSIFLTLTLFSAIFLNSCRKDFNYTPTIQSLQFSNDTIFLDTVTNNTNSETYLLNVYNNSKEDIEIPRIYLSKKNKSYYRINVEGRYGFEFNNISLRAKDSLNIFITLAAETATNPIYEDKIIFENKGNKKNVTLVSFIAKAQYFVPQEGKNKVVLNQNTTLDNSLYHVIYGNLEVAEGKTLNIEKGTKILFYTNGKITLAPKATLNINGELKNPVVLKGQRFNARYDSLPKQWHGIMADKNSQLNINYAEFKGGNQTLCLKDCTANINNTKIYNSGTNAIYAKNARIKVNNLVINNAGDVGILLQNGGNYTFNYTSIANLWQENIRGIFGSNTPLAVQQSAQENTKELQLNINNSILYGRAPKGIELNLAEDYTNNIRINHCVIKNTGKPLLNINQAPFKGIITENPLFKSTLFSSPNLSLKPQSPAIKKGDATFNAQYPLNINGVERNNPPNIGAY